MSTGHAHWLPVGSPTADCGSADCDATWRPGEGWSDTLPAPAVVTVARFCSRCGSQIGQPHGGGCIWVDSPDDRVVWAEMILPDSLTLEHTSVQTPEHTLRQWWRQHAEDEARKTCAKMIDYGSNDLVALGQDLRRMSGKPPLPAIEAMELGCLMYLLGKVHRAIEAVADGRTINVDHWFDMAVYAKMPQAARAGAWKIKEY